MGYGPPRRPCKIGSRRLACIGRSPCQRVGWIRVCCFDVHHPHPVRSRVVGPGVGGVAGGRACGRVVWRVQHAAACAGAAGGGGALACPGSKNRYDNAVCRVSRK